MDTAGNLAPANAYAELACVALAHLAPASAQAGSLHAAASLFDGRLLLWVRDHLPADAWQPLAADAEVISRLVDSLPATELLALQWLPLLHRDLAALRRTARLELGQLSPGAVESRHALAALRSVSAAPVELLRCALLLCAPAWGEAHASTILPEVARACEAVAPWLERAIAIAPALGRHEVRLVHALGPRGRVFGEEIFVGAPCAWNQLPPEHAAVQALHEAAVHAASAMDSGQRDPAQRWAAVESAAIAAVHHLAAGSELAAGHRAWRARFDLRPLPDGDPSFVSAVARSLQAS